MIRRLSHRFFYLYVDSFKGLSRDVWWLSAVMLVNRSGAMVMPFLSVYLTLEQGYTLVEAGYILTCYGLGAVAGSYIGGWLTDRFGAYPIQFWTLFASGFAFISLIFLESFWGWCFGLFIAIAITDSFRPANMAAIGVYSKPENRVRSMALLRLAINLGFAIGPAIGGLIVLLLNDYKWLFILDGLTCIAAAFLFRIVLKNKYPKKQLLEEQPDILDAPISKNSAIEIEKSSPYTDKTFLLFIFFAMLNFFVFMQMFYTVPPYWKEHLGLDEGQMGLLMGMNGLLIALIEMPLLHQIENKFRPLTLIGFGAFLIGMGFWAFEMTNWVGIAIISMLFITIGEILNFPFASTFSLNRASEHNRGAYMGLYGMSFSIGATFAPTVGTFLAENYSFEMLWAVMGALCMISATGMFFLRKWA